MDKKSIIHGTKVTLRNGEVYLAKGDCKFLFNDNTRMLIPIDEVYDDGLLVKENSYGFDENFDIMSAKLDVLLPEKDFPWYEYIMHTRIE